MQSCVCQKKVVPLWPETTTRNMAKKIFLFIGALMWFVSLSAIEVVRLVPIDGTAQDVPVASLRKVVFTADSIVFVPAVPNGIQQSAVYKYDYSTMLFVFTEPTEIERTEGEGQSESVKFIQEGRLYIRCDNKVYDVFGALVE